MTDHSRDVAIVAVSQTPAYGALRRPRAGAHHALRQRSSCPGRACERHDIDFTLAGSCDYLSGAPFAFVM